MLPQNYVDPSVMMPGAAGAPPTLGPGATPPGTMTPPLSLNQFAGPQAAPPGGLAGAGGMPPPGGGPTGPSPPIAAGGAGAGGGPAPPTPGTQSIGPQVDPNLVKAVLGAQQFAPQLGQAQRQLALADRLRAQAPGMMQSQSRIGTPNVMGSIAGALAGMRANSLDAQAQALQQGVATQRQGLYEQLFGKPGQPPGASQPPGAAQQKPDYEE